MPNRFDIDDVLNYLDSCFKVFSLPECHDIRRVYLSMCYQEVRNFINTEKPVSSRRGHIQLVGGKGGRKDKSNSQGDDSVIWLDEADMLWAIAAIHFVCNHQRKNVIERAAPNLMLAISSRTIRCLLNYCVDCSLCQISETYSTMDADMILTSALNEKGEPKSRKKVLQLLKDHGSAAAPQQDALCRRLYLGQLWTYLSRKWTRRTDIVFVGFLKITDKKGILFSLDNDSGVMLRTDAIEFREKTDGMNQTHCFVPRETLRLPLLNHLSNTCQYDTKLININIYHFDLFDAVPCDVCHWIGEWHDEADVPTTGTRDEVPFRTALPIVLASAIHRFLFCITDGLKIQDRSPLWKTVARNSDVDWFTTVLCFYHETQWEIHRPRNSSFILKHNNRKKELDAIGASNFHEDEIVDVSSLVRRHLSEVILADEDYRSRWDRGVEGTAQRREVYPLRRPGVWNNGPRENLNSFNFELVTELVPEGCHLEDSEIPPVRLQTLKVLLYIYVFRDAIKRDSTIPDSIEEAEELFEQYWEEFLRRAPHDEIRFLTDEAKEEEEEEEDQGEAPMPKTENSEEAFSKDGRRWTNGRRTEKDRGVASNGGTSRSEDSLGLAAADDESESDKELKLTVIMPRKNSRTASCSDLQTMSKDTLCVPTEDDGQKEQQSKKRKKMYRKVLKRL